MSSLIGRFGNNAKNPYGNKKFFKNREQSCGYELGVLKVCFIHSYWSLFYKRRKQNNWEKNQKTFFDFLSPGLGINVFLFRLRQFEKVGSELGLPVAGVEIGTG